MSVTYIDAIRAAQESLLREDPRVFLYGQDLNRWSLPAARQRMAFVAQDTYLFPVSIAENIACGRPGASFISSMKVPLLTPNSSSKKNLPLR